jgi:membrane protein
VALIRRAIDAWVEDKAPTMAAALAYYSFFSIAPVIIIAIAVAGLVFGEDAARGEISRQLRGLVGEGGAKAVEGLIASASGHRAGVTATVVGLAAILFGATGVFAELQESLNTIWKAPPRQTSGVSSFLRTRFLSFAVVLGIGFLLLVSLVLSAILSAIAVRLQGYVGWAWLGQGVSSVVSFGVTALLFAMIFKLLPDVRVDWKDVWFGATVTAVLFSLGKLLLGLYLGKTSILSTYGAASSLAALLLWVYYSSMILLFGAELSHAMAEHRRGQAAPATQRGPRTPSSPRLVPGLR